MVQQPMVMETLPMRGQQQIAKPHHHSQVSCIKKRACSKWAKRSLISILHMSYLNNSVSTLSLSPRLHTNSPTALLTAYTNGRHNTLSPVGMTTNLFVDHRHHKQIYAGNTLHTLAGSLARRCIRTDNTLSSIFSKTCMEPTSMHNVLMLQIERQVHSCTYIPISLSSLTDCKRS